MYVRNLIQFRATIAVHVTATQRRPHPLIYQNLKKSHPGAYHLLHSRLLPLVSSHLYRRHLLHHLALLMLDKECFRIHSPFQEEYAGQSICLTVLIYYIYYFIYSAVIEATESTGVIIFMMLTLIPMLWLFWAQGAKRCHDRDNSGFYMLIPFYMFVMMFGKGDAGTNSYGDDPKA